jgi:hypothetical protein
MITPVKITPIAELMDFKSGPFSDDKQFPIAKRRVICEKLLREMLKHPDRNAKSIILVNEALKGL